MRSAYRAALVLGLSVAATLVIIIPVLLLIPSERTTLMPMPFSRQVTAETYLRRRISGQPN